MIPLILLHIAISAQVGQPCEGVDCNYISPEVAHGVSQEQPQIICNGPCGDPCWKVNSTNTGWDYICGTLHLLSPLPAEHIIEIRTKREVDQECWTKALEDVRICTSKGHDPCIAAHVYEFTACETSTKTLWIDGQRIGVIKETEEK